MVDTAGLVASTGNGTATVTATVTDLTDVVDVKVEQIPLTLQLSPQELHFTERGDTIRITAETLDANEIPTPGPDSIRWESTRPDVISVSAVGLARAESLGKAIITAWADSLTPTSVDGSAEWESWLPDLSNYGMNWLGRHLRVWAALSPYTNAQPPDGIRYRMAHRCAIGETIELIMFYFEPRGRRFRGSTHTTGEGGDVWFVSRVPIEWTEPVSTQDTITVWQKDGGNWVTAFLQEESVPAFLERLILDRQRITVHFPMPDDDARVTFIGGWTAAEAIEEIRRRCTTTP